MTIQCCKCHKVKIADEWTPSAISHTDPVSHTYCPICFAEAQSAIRAEQIARKHVSEFRLAGV